MVAWIAICCVIGVLLLLVLIYEIIANYNLDKNPKKEISDPTGFVKAEGRNLYDGEGRLLRLQGVDFGDWLVQEYWMNVSTLDGYETGIYTQKRALEAMRKNPRLTSEQIEELNDLYLRNFIQEEDFRTVSDLGMNTIRIPFTYLHLTEKECSTLKKNAFRYLDWAISMCEKYHLYAVLDLHGAIGSQNMDHHSGDDAEFHLYDSQENRGKTIWLWTEIATHFKDSKTICGYDLLNEPRRKKHRYGGKINFDFYDELYTAVRKVDQNHLIFIECFSFPYNGRRLSHYHWDNICMEYHIYNLTPFSQGFCDRFYNATHNLMGYKTPVYIGEWNAFKKDISWKTNFNFFEKMGWSHTSWTYKTNATMYLSDRHMKKDWGLYELHLDRVNLFKDDYETIKKKYEQVSTSHAMRTKTYDRWNKYLSSRK